MYSAFPVFFSKSFIVSGLTFRFLIHFEFIFVYGIREHSNFILILFYSQNPQAESAGLQQTPGHAHGAL